MRSRFLGHVSLQASRSARALVHRADREDLPRLIGELQPRAAGRLPLGPRALRMHWP